MVGKTWFSLSGDLTIPGEAFMDTPAAGNDARDPLTDACNSLSCPKPSIPRNFDLASFPGKANIQ